MSYAPLPPEQVPENASRYVPLPLFSKRCHHCGAWISVWEEYAVGGPDGRYAHTGVCPPCGRRLAAVALRAERPLARRRRLRMALPAHRR